MSNLHILVEAKIEYTKTLVSMLSSSILEGIQSIYDDSKTFCDKNRNNKFLITFQHNLSEIPKWNQTIISDEYARIVNKSNCDWLEDLITAVFISNAKVLTSIKNNESNKTLNLKIPKGEHFIHKSYIECARVFWKNPYLFYHKNTDIEQQKNLREAEKIIYNTLEDTVRKLLPVKAILQEYLGNNFEDDDIDNENIENILSNNQKNNIKKMVQKDIESVIKECSNDNIVEDIKNDTDSNTDFPKVEEQNVEENKVEENQTEKPKLEENQTEEPKLEENQTEENQIEEPKLEEKQTEENQIEEPKLEESKINENNNETKEIQSQIINDILPFELKEENLDDILKTDNELNESNNILDNITIDNLTQESNLKNNIDQNENIKDISIEDKKVTNKKKKNKDINVTKIKINPSSNDFFI